MGAESLVDRMLAAEGLVESHSIRTGQLTDEEMAKVYHCSRNRRNASIYIDDTPGIPDYRDSFSFLVNWLKETGNLEYDFDRLFTAYHEGLVVRIVNKKFQKFLVS